MLTEQALIAFFYLNHPARPVQTVRVFFYLERDMSTAAPSPIPTPLNIAPRGKTWKNWHLVDGEDGFKTRETMEKYHCNPERVQSLEEERLINLETIDRLNARIAELEAQLAAAQQGVQPFGWFFIKSQLPGDYEFTRDGERANEARKYGYKPVPLFTHPTQQGLDADMFWDADDPERCETSINNVVVEVDSYRGLKVGDTVTIQRAKSLPDLEVRVTQVPDTEGNGDLEWAEIDAAQAKQGAAHR